MPPILIDRQGSQLIYQNEDGSTFPVASDGLSPDYLNQLSSGMAAPSPQDQLMAQVQQPTGGRTDLLNPPPLTHEEAYNWQAELNKRGAPNTSAEELAALNKAKTVGAPFMFNDRNEGLGSNIKSAPTTSGPLPETQTVDAKQELGMAPEAAAKPEAPSQLERSFNQQAQGIRKEYEATAKAAEESAKKYTEASDEYLATQNKMRVIQEEGQKLAETQMQKIAAAQDAYQKMEIRNPWAEMSTASKIGAAIAIGMGSHAAALLKTENSAYNIIQDAVKRDVDIQMKQIEKKGTELAHDKDYLSLIKAATNDKSTQALLLKDLKLASIENQIKGIQANSQSDIAKGKMDQALSKLSQDRQSIALDVAQKQANLGKTLAEMSATQGGKPENFIPGVGYALTADDAKEAKGINNMALNFNATLNAAREHRKSGGISSNPVSDATRRGESMATDLLLQIKELGKLGVLSKSDIEDVVRPMLPSNISNVTGDVDSKLNELEKFISRKTKSFYQSRGISAPNSATGDRREITPEIKKALLQEANDNLNNPDPKIAARAKQVIEAYK